MRLSIFIVGFLLSALLVSLPSSADTIVLRSGEKVEGRLAEYVDQQLRIEMPDGKVITHKMIEVERIEFPETPTAAALAIQAKIEKAIEEAKPEIVAQKRPRSGVAMYLDTAEPGAEVADNKVNYKCYRGYGYSGNVSVPLREAFVRREYSRDGDRRIELDPGPPFKVVIRHVTLKEGEVTNLGHILLERQEFEGTASIMGTVRDHNGALIPGATVTAGDQEVVSDEKGRYRLDGFELENVSITTKASGYRGEKARVSIRDMSNREIEQELKMFRPRRMKLRYVISAKDDSSFVGPDVEKGSIDVVIESSQTRLKQYHFDSDSFRKFVADTGLSLGFYQGQVRLNGYRGPVCYRKSASGSDFDEIESMGDFDYNEQRCPLLEEGNFVLMRGFGDTPGSKVSPYCVKILFEEYSLEPTDVEAEEE